MSAPEKLAFEIVTDTKQTEKSVKTIKTQLKEANLELIKAQENFGDYSNEALNAAKNVAKLKDQVNEARETADLFDPGKKFQAFSGVLQTTAAGYAGLQGAIGLFGTESAELEKQLLKVQSALALSEGLSAVKDGAKDFNRLGAIIKTQVVTAFSTLKGAIIATGIGALVVGVGLLIANFEAVKKVVLNFIPGLAKVGEFVAKLVNKITDFVGATSEASRAYDKLANTNKLANEEIDRRIKLLQAQGGKEVEIAKISKQQLENQLNDLRAKYESEKGLRGDDLKNFEDLKNQKKVIDAQETVRLKGEEEKRAADRKTVAEKEEADKKAAEEKKKKEFDDYVKRIQAESAAKKAQKDFELTLELDAIETLTVIDEANKEKQNERNEAASKNEQATANANAREIKRISDDSIRDKEIKAQAEMDLLKAVGVALGEISDILGKETAAGKALAVASTLINTYAAIAGQLKAFSGVPIPGYAIVQAVTTGLVGFKAVKNILSTKVPGGGGGGASAPSGFSASGVNSIPQAPIQSGVPIQQTQAIGTANVNVQNQQTIKAYVVERDITDSQDRISKIKAAATI